MKIPRHVAIIMDGNGRWAKKRRLPRVEGHRAGAEALRRTVDAAIELGVEYLTFYAFSVDNWKRSKKEVDNLMNILRRFLRRSAKEVKKKQVRFIVIGRINELPEDIIKSIDRVMAQTADNKKLNLVLALNYGGRSEIVDGIKRFYQDLEEKKVTIDDLTEKEFNNYLYTREIPDPDLLIRTSNEMRLSNFLLWQASYTELWFSPVYWPEFNREYLQQAITEYNDRERRYGGR